MSPMKRITRRHLMLAGVTLAGIAAIVVPLRSPTIRASFSAGYRAFRDPALLDRPANTMTLEPTGSPVRLDENRLLDAAIARDFDKATGDDLDDPESSAISALAMPDLRIPITRRTMRFVKFFSRTESGRTTFGERFARGGKYRAVIEHALREAGLPEDLVWLAAVESGFDPRATSQAGAVGLFQFMPETGALYGLDQSQWVDERRSITRSTTAAVAHLRDLYERFRRWDLALAAYNAGVENVLRAMAKAAELRPRGAPATAIGFAELAQQKLLPEETMNYVPQIVAFAIVASNRARFGLDAFHPDPPLELGEIAVPEGTRLRTIARAAGISTHLVREYNPELLRDRTPTYGGDYIIHLPGERIQQTLAAFPAYLEHERVDDPNGDRPGEQATAMAAPKLPGDEFDDDGEAPLPPRPSPIGKNRLPTFILPGQSPSGLDMSNLGALGAKLPSVYIGGDVGWRRQTTGEDPLSVLAANDAPSAAAAKGLNSTNIQKQLGIVATPTKAAAEDPFERFVLQNGVVVRLRTDASAPRVAITVRIAPEQTNAVVGVADVLDQLGSGEVRHTITVSKRDVDLGFELAAGRLRLLLGEATGAPLASLRRLSALPRRHALEQAPYGPALLTLGDMLFPPGHPLEGRVLGAREDANVMRDLLLAESFANERSPSRATITVIGDVSRKRVQELCDRLLISLPTGTPIEVPMHPREERAVIEQNVPNLRALYGWIAPGEENVKMHAAIRVATWILSSSKGGRLDRALVEKGYASEVKAHLDAGTHASVAYVDVMPAIPHDLAVVEARLDAELDAFVESGPTSVEIAYAVAHLKSNLKKEIASQGGEVAFNAPKYANSARIREVFDPGTTAAILTEYDKMSVQTVKQALRQTLSRHHRVVVTTMPKTPSK